MNRTLAVIAAAAVTSLSAAACGSPAASSSAPPALPAAEQAAITEMTAHCTQNATQLAAMVTATRAIEVKGGVTDESATHLAQHLETVVAAYGSKKVSCVDPFAEYATMRTGGS